MKLIDQLIENYSSPSEEIEITLPAGEVLKFRAVSDYSELQRLKRESMAFADLIEAQRTGKKANPAWKDILPSDRGAAVACFMISHMIIEPKLTQTDVLKLAKNCAWLIETIFTELGARQTKLVAEHEINDLEALGEG